MLQNCTKVRMHVKIKNSFSTTISAKAGKSQITMHQAPQSKIVVYSRPRWIWSIRLSFLALVFDFRSLGLLNTRSYNVRNYSNLKRLLERSSIQKDRSKSENKNRTSIISTLLSPDCVKYFALVESAPQKACPTGAQNNDFARNADLGARQEMLSTGIQNFASRQEA